LTNAEPEELFPGNRVNKGVNGLPEAKEAAVQNSLSDSITLVTTLVFYWMILNLAAPAFTHKAGETEPPNADSKLKTFIRDMLEKRGEHFSVSDFLYGAREARRVILHDFARGDKDGLRPLVTKEVFDAFCKAIDERTLRQETLDISLDERSSAYIADARSLVDCSEITVVFAGSKTETVHTADGTEQSWSSDKRLDRWTFRREQNDRDQNWCAVLIDTVGIDEIAERPSGIKAT
jgi:predicted lipid-binding transport protein (Tim44 family)